MIGLMLAAAAAAAPAADPQIPAGAVVVNPTWVRRPNPAELKAGWPVKGRGVHEASVVITCRINVSGLAENCRVVRETPAGKDFGYAALQLTPNFVFRPMTVNGKPVPSEWTEQIRYSGGGDVWGGGLQIESFTNPPWQSAPTVADVTAALPSDAKALGGHAVVQCSVKPNGGVNACDVLSTSPGARGPLSQAALKLTSKFTLNVDGLSPARLRTIRVTIPFTFPDPAKGGIAVTRITSPVWRMRPSALALPDDLIAKGITEGRAVVTCRVKADGVLSDCHASDEEPAGSGIAPLVVGYVSRMELSPWADGRPVDGAVFSMPIRVKAPPLDTSPASSNPPPAAQPR